MQLFYRKYGNGLYLIIIHGLYGSSDNWHSISKNLSKNYCVIVPDLPNHGNSPHINKFDYNFLVDTIKNFLDQLNIKRAYFIGHSLGGRILLLFSQKYPQIVKKGVIVDIPPRNLTDEEFFRDGKHQKIIDTLKKLDLKKFRNRQQVISFIDQNYDFPKRLSLFLVKNIKNENGELKWKINLKVIAKNLKTISNGFNSFNPEKLTMPLLFIKGERSPYITKSDEQYIINNFKSAEIEMIKETTHWLFTEKPMQFVKIVEKFLTKN